MFIPIIAIIAGLALGSRSKPLSRQFKLKMLGPKSGAHYEVEDLPDSGILIVHAMDGTVVTFERTELSAKDPAKSPLRFRMARGNAGTVRIVKEDFLPEETAKSAPSPTAN